MYTEAYLNPQYLITLYGCVNIQLLIPLTDANSCSMATILSGTIGTPELIF